MKLHGMAGLAFCGLMGMSVLTTGCCRKSSSSSSSTGGGNTVTMSNAKVKFDAPAGWLRTPHSDGWTQYMAPDKYASLAFVTFNKPGESTARIGQMAGVLGVDNIAWGSGQGAANIGPNKYPSRYGEGTCKIHGGDACYLWYATVNPGTSEQVLIVYAVNTVRGTYHKQRAKEAVDSLRAMLVAGEPLCSARRSALPFRGRALVVSGELAQPRPSRA